MIILLVHLKLPPCRWRSNHLGTTPQVLLSFGVKKDILTRSHPGSSGHKGTTSPWTTSVPMLGGPTRSEAGFAATGPCGDRAELRAETVRSCPSSRLITRRGRSVDLSFCYEVTGCCTGHEKVTFQGDWFWGVLGSKVYRRKLMKLQRGTDVACSILFLLTRECPARVVPGTICARQKAVNIVVNGTSLYLL